MSATFAADWLALREPADARARDEALANALSAHFALRGSIEVADIGAGTGANLRATAPLLPARQSWVLIDHDAAMLASARAALKHWGDGAQDDGADLSIKKGGLDIRVTFRIGDLASDLDALLPTPCDLVTASAFFDLTSADYVRRFARAVAQRRAALYAVLTYNGVQRWQPHRPQDSQMTAAFHRHQMRDKGFGPAAGPLAAGHLADQFRLNGYSVLEGESAWHLGRDDRMLMAELVRGNALAVAETGAVSASDIEAWVKVPRTAAIIGHTDILAIPS